MDVAEECLLAIEDDLHRASRAQGEKRNLYLHAQVFAGTESSTYPGQVNPDLVERQRQASGHLVLVDVQPLGGDVKVDAAVLGRDRKARLRPERGLVLHAGFVVALDHDRPGGLRISTADPLAVQDVAEGVDRLRVDRRHRVDERFGRLVVDDHRGRSAPRRLGVVRGHCRDGLTLVAHDIGGEDGLIGVVEPVGLAAGNILTCDQCPDAGYSQSRRGVYSPDDRRRIGRADDVAPEHALGEQVGGEGELAPNLRYPVRPSHALAQATATFRDRRAHCRRASWTAWTAARIRP